ncbi:class I SAM-dependent methyltransferase [Microcoleus sp. FACHB-53]|nr:class I SAM-dependent methyltransferase [Microcoleus sp. FACHB-53]
MASKKVNNFIDSLLLSIFQKLPIRLINRFLWLFHRNPTLGDKWGYYIRKFHYYDPLPNFSDITKEQVLKRRISTAIDWNLEAQINLIQKLSLSKPEIDHIKDGKNSNLKFNFLNDFYSEVDAAIYYTLIREIKPTKIIEIGCGYSTQIAALAIAQNQQEGKRGKIICIEPYPEPQLIEANLDVELLIERVENIDLKNFEPLSANDILFIDSTHTVKFGSDVCREILEILPALASGVWIHFHDIFFPYDYPPQWLIEKRLAWNEQYMLEAFLAYNSRFEVVLANHWLSVDYPQEVAKIWPGVVNWEKDPYHHCAGLWLRKK